MVLGELDLRRNLRLRWIIPNLTQFEKRRRSLERICRLSAPLAISHHSCHVPGGGKNELCNFVGVHGCLCPTENLHPKLLYVCIRGNAIRNCFVVGLLAFELHGLARLSAVAKRTYLLELINEVRCVEFHFFVGCVEAFFDYLVYDPEVAWMVSWGLGA